MAGATPRSLGRTGERLKRLRRLGRERAERERTATYVVEGPRLVEELLGSTSASDIEGVYVERGRYPDLVRDALGRGVDVWEADDGVLAGALTTSNPQPAAAVVRRPDTGLRADIPGHHDGLSDPGNAGTLLRTASSVGGSVILCGEAVDPFAPKVVRAAAGAASRVPIAVVDDLDGALHALAEAGIPTVAAMARGGRPPETVDLASPVALVVGAEAGGLDEAIADRVDHVVTIPTTDETESLNVGVAASVLLHESARQTRRRDEADSMLDLVSRVSHELRSPLTAVKGFTGALLARWDRLDDDQKRSMLADVAREADHVSRLVTELLEVSRLDGERLRLERRYAEPADLVRQAMDQVATGHPDAAPTVEVGEDLPTVAVDGPRIVATLANLVENALKYGDASTVLVSAQADDDEVVFEVMDGGDGMDSEQLAVAFDRRARHGGRPSGIGMGLWLGRALVEAHGGSLELRSSPGDGVRAELVLPAAPTSGNELDAPA